MTPLAIINAAMRKVALLASGENASASESADGLVSVNLMLDAWSGERLMVFTVVRQVFTLIAGQQAYTLGTGGDFNVPRPANIDRVSIISLANSAQPLELPIPYLTDAQWQAIPVKNIQSSLPQYVWDDGGFPLRTLSYWAIPNTTCQTAIYTWTALSQFANLTTDYTFPPGYLRAIIYNLALELAAEFGKSVLPGVQAIATQSKAAIQAINVPILDLKCDAALVQTSGGIYNWLSDQTTPPGSQN
jgi:hypothetical protein